MKRREAVSYLYLLPADSRSISEMEMQSGDWDRHTGALNNVDIYLAVVPEEKHGDYIRGFYAEKCIV